MQVHFSFLIQVEAEQEPLFSVQGAKCGRDHSRAKFKHFLPSHSVTEITMSLDSIFLS